MPTGYTSEIHDGKEVSLENFTLTCARAFGACVEQRDDDMRVKPKLAKVSDYYSKEIAKARKELQKFNKKNPKSLQKEFEIEVKNGIKDAETRIQENSQLAARYNQMIDKVEKWQPPSPEHEGLKKFMLGQLNDSLKFDCIGGYYERQIKEFESLTFDTWLKNIKEHLIKNIEYDTKELNKEKQRTNERNDWIKKLYKSLGKTI